MEKIWARDLEKLQKTKHLPSGFFEIREVKMIFPAEKAKIFFAKIKNPDLIKSSTAGRFILEIFIDAIDAAQGGGIMMQYDLIEIKSGNTVWELGRTFSTVKL